MAPNTGSLDDGKKLLEYYGTERAEQVKRDIAEIGENTAMDASAYYVQFKKAFETEKFITYTSEIYEYSGGAHGDESLSGGVFRKSDGRKFGWDMFTANGKEKLRGMIKNGLKSKFFKVNSMKNFMKGYWMRMHVILFRFRRLLRYADPTE